MCYCYSGGTQWYTVPACFQIKHLIKNSVLVQWSHISWYAKCFNMKGLMHCRRHKLCHFLPFSNSWHKYRHHSFQEKMSNGPFKWTIFTKYFSRWPQFLSVEWEQVFLSDIQPKLTKPCMYINFMLQFLEESVKGRFSNEDGEETRSSVWLSVSYVYYPTKTNSECFLSYWCTIFATEMLNNTKG